MFLKKNFIETIFSLDIFSTMSRYLRDDIRAIKGEYSLEQNTLSIHEKSINDYNIQIENLLKVQEDYYNRRQDEIRAIKDKIVAEEGLGIDCVSGGELYTALSAGFPAEKIVFHGNNKTYDDEFLKWIEALDIFWCN